MLDILCRKWIFPTLLTVCAGSASAALIVVLDGTVITNAQQQQVDFGVSMFDFGSSNLVLDSGLDPRLTCGPIPTDPPAPDALTVQIDDNPAVAIAEVVGPGIGVLRVAADTEISLATIDGNLNCSQITLDEEFFADGFEDPPPVP